MMSGDSPRDGGQDDQFGHAPQPVQASLSSCPGGQIGDANVSVAVWRQAGSNARRRVQISRVAKMEIQVLALPTRIFGGHILRSIRLVVAVAVAVGSLTVTTV